MRLIGKEPSVVLRVRIPGELYAELEALADAKNPVRELVRDAIRRFVEESSNTLVGSEPRRAVGRSNSGNAAKELEPIGTRPSGGLDDHATAEMPTDPKPKKTCKHGTSKGYNCWQCGGLAQV